MKTAKVWRTGFHYLVFISSLIVLFSAFPAASQEFPTRPIKVIVPYPPGGTTDLAARSMVDAMEKVLGQPVVIENKPGGGTTLAYGLVAKAKPDGYTVGFFALGSLVGSYLAYDVPYEVPKSFSFIGRAGFHSMSIIVRKDAPWKTWNEFVTYSKKHPKEIRMGFTNPIGSNAIPTKWVNKKLGNVWKEIQFRGDAGCITQLLGGNIDAFPGGSGHNMLVKDGRARMLLALTVDPIPGHPNVPTFKQVYGKDIINIVGYMAPAGISGPILAKLEKAVHEGTKTPEFNKVMDKMFMTPAWGNGQEVTRLAEKNILIMREFFKDLGKLKKKK